MGVGVRAAAAAMTILGAASMAGGLAAAPLAPAPPPAPKVRIDSGVLVGQAAGPAAVFRAVPYAAPPLGPLRWKPPAPVSPWRGPRAAAAPGPACLQVVNADGRPNLGGYVGPVSEDCLTLNVTAPIGALGHGARAPVMVWIPGGGNTAGGPEVPSYDAAGFARDGVIVVTMNYRLGPLGFFAHPALTREAPPGQPLVNYGLMDQIAALEWVKRNIAAFGGDPGNVTLFGESAGGGDTLALLAVPAARRLFHKAIIESGGGWSQPTTLAQAQVRGAALATKLGLPGDQASAEQLRSAPAERLTGQGDAAIAVDGRLVVETATQAFARGHAADVPMIIGSNSNEASLMGALGLSADGVLKETSPEVLAAYTADGPSPEEIARQVINDRFMGAPARWIAAKAAGGAPSWLYYFSYVPERQRATRPGTNHASEIPFVFDSLDAVPGRTPLITPSERAAAALTHSCWVTFAKTGRPTCAGGQAWPRYDPKTDQLLEIGVTTGVRQHFRKTQLDAQEKAAAAEIGGN